MKRLAMLLAASRIISLIKERTMKRLNCENCFAIALVFFLGSLMSAAAPDKNKKAVTIPLKNVWGYNMPGTANAEELDAEGELFMSIRRSLWSVPEKGKAAKSAFAVSGTELEVLREVHAVLVEGKKARESLPQNRDIHVVFFSYSNKPYVHLEKVERQGNVVNVHWRFVPHETEETTEHFALIPLGKLPSGKYRVNVIRSSMDAGNLLQRVRDEVVRRIVCQSFSFTVTAQGASKVTI
jgi:hypothetical protein